MNETETKTIADRIIHLRPCQDARDWAIGYTDPDKAWQECERGDWMLWLVGKKSGDAYGERRRKLALAACDCAAIALVHTKDGRVPKCIEVAKMWANGFATNEELMVAGKDAYAAYVAAYAAYADAAAANAVAVYAAVYAAYAAYAAAGAGTNAAGTYAAYAAYAAADAAADNAAANNAAAAYAMEKTLKDCADIVRRYYPDPPNVD